MTPEEQNDEPQFIPADKILLPENISDEMLEAIAPVMIAKFVGLWLQDLKRLKAAALGAANDDDALKKIRQELKDRECWISRWSERLGDRMGDEVSANLKELERLFRKAGDDLIAAMWADLPGQQEEGDEWKSQE